MLLHILLPRGRLQTQARQQPFAILQAATIVISGLFDKQVVLQKLVCNRGRQESLVCLRIYLHISGLLSSSRFKVSQNLSGSVVIGRSQNLGTDELGALLDGREDEFACHC